MTKVKFELKDKRINTKKSSFVLVNILIFKLTVIVRVVLSHQLSLQSVRAAQGYLSQTTQG